VIDPDTRSCFHFFSLLPILKYRFGDTRRNNSEK